MTKVPINNIFKKRWFKVVSRSLILLILIPVILYSIFRTSQVQTWLVSRVTHYLSKELKAVFFIKGVDISWFLNIELEGVFVSDQNKDTLLYTRSMLFDIEKIYYTDKYIRIKNITIKDARISVSRKETDSVFNYQFLVDYFSSADTTRAGEKWEVNIRGIELVNNTLNYNDDHAPISPQGIDFNHLSLNRLYFKTSGFLAFSDTVTTKIDQLSFTEKSGFSLKKMNAKLLITQQGIHFRDLVVRTGFSSIETDLSLTYKGISDFGDFFNAVSLKAYLLPSDLDFRDIIYFVPGLEGMDERVVIAGQAEGKISNLKLNDIHLDYGSFTSFRGDIKLAGLPDIKETFIQLSVKELSTNHYDLNTFRLPGGASLQVPSQITEMGNIRVKGVFTGFLNDFVSYAQFNTDIGSVFTDISLKNNDGSKEVEYSGKVRTRDFNLGLLTRQQEYFGKVNLTADLTGSGTDLDHLLLNLDGVVDSLYFRGNTFKELKISGGIFDKRFNGNLILTDPRLGFEFDGFIDFKKKKPVFDFITAIDHAWLNQLNLVKSDSVMGFKTFMTIHFEGINPDSITGDLSLDSTVFRMNHSVYFMKKLSLKVDNKEGKQKNITLLSDYADAQIRGSFGWDDLIPSFKEIIYMYFPSIIGQSKPPPPVSQPDLNFSMTLKNTRPFSKMFFPGVSLAENTMITGNYQPKDNNISLSASSTALKVFGNTFNDWKLSAASDEREALFMISGKRLEFARQMGLDNFNLTARGRQDSLLYQVHWLNENQQVKNTGDMSGYLSILGPEKYRFHINESNTVINDSVWNIPCSNIIEIDTQEIKIDGLTFVSGDERVSLSGIISDNPLDLLKLDFQNFNLSNLDLLTTPSGFNFDGLINGKLEVMNIYKAANLVSDITITGFAMNHDKLGNMNIISRWDPQMQALFTKAEVIYKGNIGENKPLSLQGYLYPTQKNNFLDFNIHIDNFKLKTISNFLASFSSKFTGFASGDMTLKGSLRKPELEGKIKVQRGEIRIDYLKTDYSFSQEFDLGKNFIGFNNVIVYDSLGNKIFVNGKINHQYFNKFSLDLDLKIQNALALNTESYDNDLFYGRAFASGDVKIHGPAKNIVIDVMARSEKGTQIFLPINLTADISDNEFITFGSSDKDSLKVIPVKPPDFTGITMNLDLEATPDGVIRIFMPDDMGTIKATGTGKIKMDVNTRGQFNIYGDYQINQGSFLFTLQNVINRLFEIQPGGTIKFSGDPYATQVDLRAIHKLDVPLTGLRLKADQQDSLTKKVPIACIIDLKGSLFNPDLFFKLSLEEKDDELNRIIFSQLDTNNQQQMSEQMIFLLVLKHFKPVERNSSIDLNASVGNSSWEILSSQLNAWLSQISKDFDIGVNYKPGNNLTSDEVTVALSTQLFNERVLIDGNIGYNTGLKNANTNTQNASNLVGDVKIEVKLTKDGRVRAKAYNKSNNVTLLENNAPYTQGVGIFFRKEFDNLRDLFRGKRKKGLPEEGISQ